MKTTPPCNPADTLAKLQAHLGAALLSTHSFRGDDTAIVSLEALHGTLQFLKEELGFNFCMHITMVDYLSYPEPRPKRFEVVYHLYSLASGARVRVKCAVGAQDQIPSACDLWAAADWLEREAWEMYGVPFAGHPNLKVLLLHKDFQGHPLRKDYPLSKRQALAESDDLMDEMEKRLVFKGLK